MQDLGLFLSAWCVLWFPSFPEFQLSLETILLQWDAAFSGKERRSELF
jgi:hypothetical protein